MPGGRKPKSGQDGRANNGGARNGNPGSSYANRSDLRTQKVSVPPSAQYGQGAALQRAQAAVPMAGAPAPPSPAASGGAPAPGPMAAPAPLPDLYRPTERPNEPVTHGLPSGPGAGPEALPIQPSAMADPIAIQIRAMLRANPTNLELANLVADLARPQ